MSKSIFFTMICIVLFINPLFSNVNGSYQNEFNFNVINENKILSIRSWNSISLIYPDQYHNYEQLTEELDLINSTAPEILEMSILGESYQGRNITLVKITNEVDSRQKANALFIGQHHAREQITVEALLRFMHEIINGYGINNDITNLINNLDIYIIPTLNPDGLHYVVEEGNEWLRRNLRSFDDDGDGLFDEDPIEDTNGDGLISEFIVRKWHDYGYWLTNYTYIEGIDNDGDGLVNEDSIGGVDLNRNYDYRWNDSRLQSGSTSDTTNPTFPGTSPFSEPETQVLKEFLSDKKFATAMSLHSGINTTYFPFSSANYWAEENLYFNIYTEFMKLTPDYFFMDYLNAGGLTENEVEHNSNTKGISYTSAGDWGDWMYVEEGCVVPLTYEIFHGASSDEYILISENETHQLVRWDGMYSYFAPQETHIDSLWQDIRNTFYYWLQLTPRINIETISVFGSNTTGSIIEVNTKITNYSPLINTITSLEVLDYPSSNQLLYKDDPVFIDRVEANSNPELSFKFSLQNNIIVDQNLTFLIGNEYIGYYSLTILIADFQEPKPTSLLLFPILLALSVVYIKKRRN